MGVILQTDAIVGIDAGVTTAVAILDMNNTSGNYHILGVVNGHWSVPVYPRVPIRDFDMALQYGPTDRPAHKLMLLNKDSPGDLLLLVDDIAIPWCGLSILGCGL